MRWYVDAIVLSIISLRIQYSANSRNVSDVIFNVIACLFNFKTFSIGCWSALCLGIADNMHPRCFMAICAIAQFRMGQSPWRNKFEAYSLLIWNIFGKRLNTTFQSSSGTYSHWSYGCCIKEVTSCQAWKPVKIPLKKMPGDINMGRFKENWVAATGPNTTLSIV